MSLKSTSQINYIISIIFNLLDVKRIRLIIHREEIIECACAHSEAIGNCIVEAKGAFDILTTDRPFKEVFDVYRPFP